MKYKNSHNFDRLRSSAFNDCSIQTCHIKAADLVAELSLAAWLERGIQFPFVNRGSVACKFQRVVNLASPDPIDKKSRSTKQRSAHVDNSDADEVASKPRPRQNESEPSTDQSDSAQSSDDHAAKDYELLDPDVRLMLQVRDDNAVAFEELMRRYQNRLVAILEHLIPGGQQAEDLAQEVFMRVYRARKSYSPGAKFSTWLFTIANNVASNALRKLARRKEIHLQSTPSGSVPIRPLENMAKDSSGLMPTRVLDRSEESEIVSLAIQSLNERQRMAVLLSKFEHMSYIDIAETMGLTTQAVKSLLSRARGNLREILQPYMQSGISPSDPQFESGPPGIEKPNGVGEKSQSANSKKTETLKKTNRGAK